MSSTIATAAREYASRPADERFPSVDALVQHATHEKELSVERTYNLKDLRIKATSENDLILASPKGEAKITHWAFGQACRMLEAPASFLREKVTAAIAATVLNHRIAESVPGSSANLLVRGANGTPYPIVRACTSESYGRCWDADLYASIAHGITKHDTKWTLPPTWTGESAGAYRGDRDSFLVLTNGGSIVTDPSLINKPGHGGEMYRGLLIRNSEVGASSVVIERILYRYICGNHMLWGAIVDKSFRRRHVGKQVTRDVIREINTIAYNWSRQTPERDQAIIQGLIDREIAITADAVVDELRSMGATQEQAKAAYTLCVEKEAVSPRSYWGVAQGLTRLSQAETHQDDRYLLDQLASKVLVRGAKLVTA